MTASSSDRPRSSSRSRLDPRREKAKTFFDDGAAYLKADTVLELRGRLVRGLVGDARGLRLLDAGCGDGRMSMPLLDDLAHLTLLDLSDGMLARAEARVPAALRERVTIVQGVAQSYAPAEPFDVVLCLGVLAHVDDAGELLDALARLTRPGGRCVVQLTDSSSAVGRLLDAVADAREAARRRRGYALNRTRYGDVVARAEQAGLHVAAEARHWRLFPGMNRLPPSWTRGLLAFTDRTDAVRAFGSERLLAFERSAAFGARPRES